MSKYFTPKPDTTPPVPAGASTGAIDPNTGIPVTQPVVPTQAFLSWSLGIPLAMHVHLSTSPIGDVFSTWTAGYRENPDKDLPHFVWENITFGDWAESRKIDLDVKIPMVSYGTSLARQNPLM